MKARGMALLLALTLLSVSEARAQDRRTESLARDAMKKAQLDALTHSWDSAIARLTKAATACTPLRCSNITRAALSRDRGAMEARKGDASAAAASFAEALRLDPSTELDAGRDSPQVRAAWRAAKEELETTNAPPPVGDFAHTSPKEQALRTPLPLYVEYTGDARIDSVVVKYLPSGAASYKRVTLDRKGSGWGGSIPCADVTLGALRYYVQGFDRDGSPAALSGDPKRPFVVMVRTSITGLAPRLPGEPPPAACDSSEAAEESPSRDEPREVPAENAQSYARIWIGVSGSIDFVPLASVDDACKLNTQGGSTTAPPYYCTNPDGSDFPTRKTTAENDSLARGNAGKVAGAFRGGTVHATATFDYAVSANALLGARIGYVARTYTGDAAVRDGNATSLPLHLELRGSLLFGDAPLAHSGFAPYAFVAAGFGEIAASSSTQVVRDGVPGQWPVNTWRASGPWFVALGGGVRYAFSPRIAFLAAIRVNASFGGSNVMASGAPELSLQYGF